MRVKKNHLLTILSFIIISLSFSNLHAGELVLVLETSAGETRFCQGTQVSITAKGFHGDEVLVEHQWESTSENIFSRTQNQYAALDGSIPGRHLITYHGTDDQGNKASISITIIFDEAPAIEIEARKGFFTRLFGKSIPVKLNSAYIHPDHHYQWYRNNEEISGATGTSFKVGQEGRYRLVITSPQGCRAYSRAIDIP